MTPDLREAYFEIKGFLLDNVDVKIGRQRIAWGTADELNPKDNIIPLDLSDIWDFSNHLGSDAVQLSVYLWGLMSAESSFPCSRHPCCLKARGARPCFGPPSSSPA